MTIRYHIGQDGSFTAGDVDSGVTAYAYPSSEHAQQAKRNPLKVAEEMIQGEMSWSRMSHLCAAYDRRNWERVLDKLFGMRSLGLSRKALDAGFDAVRRDEDGDPRTVWGMVQGLTRHSQTVTYTDERTSIDRAAGKIMEANF